MGEEGFELARYGISSAETTSMSHDLEFSARFYEVREQRKDFVS